MTISPYWMNRRYSSSAARQNDRGNAKEQEQDAHQQKGQPRMRIEEIDPDCGIGRASE
jgi:hypothetical protein